jgi:hypothetical protein
MLTPDEIATLQVILERARAAAALSTSSTLHELSPGDVVQLRPGADRAWECSLLLVQRIRTDGKVSGPILRPHRGGCRDAWAVYTPPEVIRVGRMPYPAPAPDVCGWTFEPACPLDQRKPPARAGGAPSTLQDAHVLYRQLKAALYQHLDEEQRRLRETRTRRARLA